MASRRQEMLGRYIDSLRGDEKTTAAYVPKWWNHDGDKASADQILHEIRDRLGIYFMKKKLRYDTYQASRAQNLDDKTRGRLLNLMGLVDKENPTPEEAKIIGQMYKTLMKDRAAMTEIDHMINLITYG